MANNFDLVAPKTKIFYNLMVVLSFAEGLVSLHTIISFLPDPKNAIFLGLSSSRWVLILITVLGLVCNIFLLFNRTKVLGLIQQIMKSERLFGWIKRFCVLLIICLWLTVWFPVDRFGIQAARYVRIRPLILWFELFGFQFYIFIKVVLGEINLKELKLAALKHQRILKTTFIVALIGITLFGLFRMFAPDIFRYQQYYPPGAPISALQVFTFLLLTFWLFLLEQKQRLNFLNKKVWIAAGFVFIWLTTFYLWKTAPFTCADDMAGPFIPNLQCYPNINDAVYSIGSHYTALGEGINHHWQTDKPLYMIFLAVGQWVVGPGIDQYLMFQMAVIACLPAFLFLLGNQLFGYVGGVLFATLTMIRGRTAIMFYQQVGSVNVKTENTELLVALLLIMLCYAVFKWFQQPVELFWASVSGGLLGLSALVRINPILILPIIIIAIVASNRKRLKSFAGSVAIFILTFSLVLTPWLMIGKNSNNTNFYLVKIQNVLVHRYVNEPSPTATYDVNQPTKLPKSTVVPQVILQYPPKKESERTSTSGILYHFLNNQFLSLSLLPLNLTFLNLENQVAQPIWDFSQYNPFWKMEFSNENLLVLTLNMSIVILGICLAYRRFGTAGLSALVIQIGYHLGNGFAKTSGGRFLEPVYWATLLYFGIGCFALIAFLIRIFKSENTDSKSLQSSKIKVSKEVEAWKPKTKKHLVSLPIFLSLIVGLSVPFLDQLPGILPEEMSSETNKMAESVLLNYEEVTSQDFQEFLRNPAHLVIRGKAYHPKYLRSDFFMQGSPSFELLVLGKDHVFINYILGVFPEEIFTEGSDVILVGCQIRKDSRWQASRIIMRSIAVIQLNNEKSIFVDPNTDWHCP